MMKIEDSNTDTRIKTVIGPIHPALKEPIKFTFEIEGEKVVNVDFLAGHTHRGLEWMATRRNCVQILYLADRICGICGVAHTLAFCRAVEQAAGIEVPPRAQYLRTIFGEIERIQSHLLWAGVAAMELGFDTLFYKAWEVREKVMDLLEYLSGNRVNYGMLQIGGMQRDIVPEQYDRIYEALDYYLSIYDDLAKMFLDDTVVQLRCRDTGILTRDMALKLCTAGPTIRASGIPVDIRQDQPYCAYADIDVRAATPDQVTGEVHGDVYDRIIVRLLEVRDAIHIISEGMEKMPEGPIRAFPKLIPLLNHIKKAEGEGLGRHEAPRGECFHYVRLKKGEESFDAWKIKAPTYSNLLSWLEMLKGEQIADIPIIVASIDPCISCTDRVALVRQGKKTILTHEELRKLSREKTKRLQN